MKSELLIAVAILAASLIAQAGDLEPAAAPSPTMKTLNEVEARTPIPGSATAAATFYITKSGSYYLTGNRKASGGGIQVNADNVTIDLNGYSLIGPGSGSAYGISMNGRQNVEIKNGTVRDFGGYGINESSYTSGKNHRIINVRVFSNGWSGIFLAGDGQLVKGCTAAENGMHGIQLNDASTADSNQAYGNTNSGIHVEDRCRVTNNTVNNNNHNGIFANKWCYVSGNTVCGNNLSDTATRAGILAYYDNYVVNNNASFNKMNNIRLSYSGNAAEGNLTNDCSTGYGIYFGAPGNFYANNRASNNTTDFGGSLPILGGDGGGNASY